MLQHWTAHALGISFFDGTIKIDWAASGLVKYSFDFSTSHFFIVIGQGNQSDDKTLYLIQFKQSADNKLSQRHWKAHWKLVSLSTSTKFRLKIWLNKIQWRKRFLIWNFECCCYLEPMQLSGIKFTALHFAFENDYLAINFLWRKGFLRRRGLTFFEPRFVPILWSNSNGR